MTATEKQVKIAANLYEMRDKARRLLGDKYKPCMAELGRILQNTARETGRGTLETALDICKRRNLVGMDVMLTMAAAVELTEPTP